MSKNRNPEELAQYLDELLQSSRLLSIADVGDPLAEVALQLAHDKPPQLSEKARVRMLEKVHQSTTYASSVKPKQTISFPIQVILRWVAVFVIFIVFMGNTAVPAMADSLPGDILYPAKLMIESIELSLATSDTIRAEVFIRQAERRLDEANKILESNIVNQQLIVKAIDNLESANQLESANPMIQAQIASTLNRTDNLIDRIAQIEPEVANTLYPQLLTISPTAEPALIAEESQPVGKPTTTATVTLTPTLTFTPTYTSTSMSTATFTPTSVPTATFTKQPTSTSTPKPSPTYIDEPTLTLAYESYIGVVSATTNVNIRTLPTTDSEIIQQVTPGTIVTIVSESIDGLWLRIDMKDKQQGWIANSLIIEGTIPLFTLSSTTATELTLTLSSDVNLSDNPADTSTSNQGNDDNNKFGCDGQGNSCNVGGQGNNKGNSEKNKK
jgi:hypothetical protein